MQDEVTIKVTIWNEGRHEKLHPNVEAIYPSGIHGAIATDLKNEGFAIRCGSLDDPDEGLNSLTATNAASGLVSCPRNTRYFAGGQLAVFQGGPSRTGGEAPISESYGSSEQRGKTANWPRPRGLR